MRSAPNFAAHRDAEGLLVLADPCLDALADFWIWRRRVLDIVEGQSRETRFDASVGTGKSFFGEKVLPLD